MWNSPAKTWEEALSTTSREHKGRWTGHILRRDQTNVACHALDCSPQGNHQKGWPVMTWALSVYHQQRAQGKIDRTHPVQGPMSPNQRCMSCSGLQPQRQPPKRMTSHDLGTQRLPPAESTREDRQDTPCTGTNVTKPMLHVMLWTAAPKATTKRDDQSWPGHWAVLMDGEI